MLICDFDLRDDALIVYRRYFFKGILWWKMKFCHINTFHKKILTSSCPLCKYLVMLQKNTFSFFKTERHCSFAYCCFDRELEVRSSPLRFRDVTNDINKRNAYLFPLNLSHFKLCDQNKAKASMKYALTWLISLYNAHLSTELSVSYQEIAFAFLEFCILTFFSRNFKSKQRNLLSPLSNLTNSNHISN